MEPTLIYISVNLCWIAEVVVEGVEAVPFALTSSSKKSQILAAIQHQNLGRRTELGLNYIEMWFWLESINSHHWLTRRLWKWKWSCSVMSDSLGPYGLYPTRLLHPWDSPGKNTGVGCHFLLQEIFLTQGSNPGLPHCWQTLYHLSHQGSSTKGGKEDQSKPTLFSFHRVSLPLCSISLSSSA